MMMTTMHATTTTTACNARATKIRTTVKTSSSVKRVAMKRVVKVRDDDESIDRSIDRVLDGRTGGSDEERRGVDDVVSRSVRGCFS
jgi:hypothetical protein